MAAFDELTAFVDLVHETFEEHDGARKTMLECLDKECRPDNQRVKELAKALNELAKEQKEESSSDETEASDLAQPPPNPISPPKDEEKSEEEEDDMDAPTQDWPEQAPAPTPSSLAQPVLPRTEVPTAPPAKRAKTSSSSHEAIPKELTLSIALEALGIPKRVKAVIGAMRDEPLSLDWDTPLVRGVERAIIFKLGLKMKFKQRGPPGPESGGPSSWGGQTWRSGSHRWGNRGGKNKDFYNWKYGKK